MVGEDVRRAERGSPAAGMIRFLDARWHAEVPMKVLFWRDMIVVGTIINIVTALAALFALGMKAPMWLVLAVYLLPTPYNIFLFVCVWRRADRKLERGGTLAVVGALLWLITATLI